MRFDAETAPDLGWEFRPLTRAGRRSTPASSARCFSARSTAAAAPVTGTGDLQRDADQEAASISTSCNASALPSSVSVPARAATWAWQFFVDPELLKDPSTRDVNTITLSYTMFRKPDAPAPRPVAGAAGSAATVTRAVTPTVN